MFGQQRDQVVSRNPARDVGEPLPNLGEVAVAEPAEAAVDVGPATAGFDNLSELFV
jgi:hypothetical protein